MNPLTRIVENAHMIGRSLITLGMMSLFGLALAGCAGTQCGILRW